MKSILVTGGLGFIGSAFVRKLASDNEFKRIIVLDALTYAGDLKTLSALKEDPRIEVVIGNICDRDVVAAAITDIDTVINFAAESHVDNSIDSIKPFIDSNVSGVANLLDIARAKKVSKFLQISTDEVYGSIINGAFDEDSILDPKNPYSATKAAAEHLCSAYANTYKMDISITRSCNNFGEFQQREKFIPNAIYHLLNNEPIPVYGNGLQEREWIYVEDNVDAILQLLKAKNNAGIFNIGSGLHMKNIDLAKLICRVLGKPETFIKFVDDRLGHDFRYSINSGKIKSATNWESQTEFNSALEKTVAWYVMQHQRSI